LRGLIDGDVRSGAHLKAGTPTAPLTGLTGGAQEPPEAASAALVGEPGQSRASRGVATERPVILADTRQNAVIVRDRLENMPVYEELIRSLDQPSELIEIEAMIVDINSNHVSELGIDWAIERGGATLTLNGGATDGAALRFARGLAGSGSFLYSQLRALETGGNARIVSRPSIVTSNNLSGLIDLSETFYIRNQGERVANVVPVTVGLTLQVTPRVVNSPGGRMVQLVVDIEDGAVQQIPIGGMPAIRRGNVGTQATVGVNESLLIGGFTSEMQDENSQGVRGLSTLPLIGALFGTKTSTNQRRQRMFVITPRIVGHGVGTP
jgi:type III secretion protein C